MRKKRISSHLNHSFEESLVNLTPLIDVVFVVLIAFILIAPLVEVDHVDLAPATLSSEKDLTSKGTINIYVNEDDSIRLNNRLVADPKELTNLLKDLKKRTPGQVPQLFHDRKACFGTYQLVKNSVETAGFGQMDVILKGSAQ